MNVSCRNCLHFQVCKIIDRLKGTLKRHKKIFKPTTGEGPTEKMYKVIGEGCLHFEREK